MISETAKIGRNVVIKPGVVIGENAVIGDNSFLDSQCMIRDNVFIGENSYVGPYCILGEYQASFYQNFSMENAPLRVGDHAVIRSHSVLYSGSTIGAWFQTGHHVTVREGTQAGSHWRLGTLSDVQGDCTIGEYVNMHSNVHIGKGSQIGNYVWIFPYCVLTNDPIPPSVYNQGVTIQNYAVVATGSILLPGITLGENSLVGAGSVVTKSVSPNMGAVGCPAKEKGLAENVRDPITGQSAYPWPERFDRGMPWQGKEYGRWTVGENQ